jgi:hypothetical protein
MATTKTVKPDKYAQDARAWRDFAKFNLSASMYLFESHDPFKIFAAATLGHHALEMYLKAALICEGWLLAADCAWGHDLVTLARQLAAKRADFDLAKPMMFLWPWHSGASTVERGFEVFNPFFSELRYPQQLTMGGVGEDDKLTLNWSKTLNRSWRKSSKGISSRRGENRCLDLERNGLDPFRFVNALTTKSQSHLTP